MKIQSKKRKNLKINSLKSNHLYLLALFSILIFFGLFVFLKELNHGTKVTNIPPQQVSNRPTEFNPIFDKVIFHGNEDKKEIALSFDADMTYFMKEELKDGNILSFYNQRVIEVLREKNIPATFFLSGLWAETYPEVAKELASDPLFEIGNHSYSHPGFTSRCFNLSRIADKEKEQEFIKSQEVLTKLIGYTPKLFRFPGGCFQNKDLILAKKYGLTTVHWSVDGRDAFNSNIDRILNAVKKETKPGSILIFHMSGGKAPKTGESLPLVIDFLQEKGYRFVKVGEMISQLNL